MALTPPTAEELANVGRRVRIVADEDRPTGPENTEEGVIIEAHGDRWYAVKTADDEPWMKDSLFVEWLS